MEYTGLLFKYKINRPLTEDERARQLKQKERLDVNPIHQLTLLRVNSTYLETVDKFYVWRGLLTLFMGPMTAFCFWMLSMFGLSMITPELVGVAPDVPNDPAAQSVVALVVVFFIPFLIVSVWAFVRDTFGYRYYPMRFNRKTRMVHVFRLNGTVLSAPWDELFFTRSIGVSKIDKNWNVRGHVLDKDGVTVKETFALGFWDGREEAMKHYWEYIRRYMEGEPMDYFVSSLDGNSKEGEDFCLPILFNRESWWFGFNRNLVVADTRGTFSFQPSFLFFAPISFVVSVGRYIAMRTSKQPHWPADIEAQCVIEPDDPYERDARHNQRPLWGMKIDKSAKPL